MARIRTIKPQFFTSEDICRLSAFARLLFQGLWCEADREGYLADRPFQLKMRLLPVDDCDVDDLLWELDRAGLILRYRAADDGKDYIRIVTFLEHQRPHPKEPKSLIPQAGSRRAVEKNGEQVILPGDIPSSPVGMDKEYGDLGREGKGTEPLLPAPVQGRGASEPGSLPRDHMKHALCGPKWKVCLKAPWQRDELLTQYNHPDPKAAAAALVSFLEVLENIIGPDDAIGDFRWIEKSFQGWLKTVGRGPKALEARGSDVPSVEATQKMLAERDALHDRRFDGLTLKEKFALAKQLREAEA